MSDTAYEVTIGADTYDSYVSQADAEKELAVNDDLRVATDFTFTGDSGAAALVRVSLFFDSLELQLPEGTGDLSVTTPEAENARKQLRAACTRETMARAVANARPISITSRAALGDLSASTDTAYHSRRAEAARRGFYNLEAYGYLRPFLLEASTQDAQLFATVSPEGTVTPFNINNYRDQ